jgi:SnoaL-like domain
MNIEDWLALCELKARYCRLMDTKQWDAWRELFTEDYELDVTAGTDLPVIKGREAAPDRVLSSIRHAVTAHQVHSPEIRIDGDAASGIWAMQDRVIFSNGTSLTGYGHYHDRFRRQDGQWRIAALKLTRLHLEMIPAR